MSSTTPVCSSKVTRSPMRIGWVMASRIPAIALASVWRAAKPTTRPSTADEARIPVATRFTDGNCASASATPSRMITAKISRRTSLRRVAAIGESSPFLSASPILCPRRASARSTSSAKAKASRIVATAVISLRYSATNEAAVYKSAPSMAHQATSHALAGVPARALAAARGSEALTAAWRVLWPTRLALFAVAVFAVLSTGVHDANALRFDEPVVTHPFGGFGDLVLSPLARWDSIWYLEIAREGYGESGPRAAFFPLFPLIVRGLSFLGGGSPGAVLVAGYAVSLGALLGALVLLWKLTVLELGRRLGSPTLLLLCVFPGALFLGAPYSESLFLLVSVGAFLAARTERWPWAGAAL